MKLRIIGLTSLRIFSVEESHESIALAASDWPYLMKCAAGEHDGPAFRSTVGLVTKLGKYQIATFIILVEVDRDGEAPVLRARVDFAAMR
jgi:hypothetical protein